MAFLRGKQNPQVQRLRILQQDIEERKNEKVYIESFDYIVKVICKIKKCIFIKIVWSSVKEFCMLDMDLIS